MKLKLYHKILIVITAALLIFTIGFAAGRKNGETIINITVSKLTEEVLSELSASDRDVRITVDINSAGLTELQLLPGIDSDLAESIIALRNELGGFTDISQIKDAEGMNFVTWGRIKSLIIL